jgi:Fe-S cluster assembly iron-binding protein IscA
MVTFTDNAIEKFRELLNGKNTHGIRIYATGDGC